MERFEIWFGGMFVAMGLIGFAIGGGLYAAYGRASHLRAVLGAPLIIGAIFATVGSGFVGYGLWQWRVERHALEHGTTVVAFVRGPEQTQVRVNGRNLWRVRYQYPDQTGRPHEGSSGLMDADEAQLWHEAGLALVRYDPDHPSDSVWLGLYVGTTRQR